MRTDREQYRIDLEFESRMRDYESTAKNLKFYGLTVTFSDESDIVGEEMDDTPVIFAEVMSAVHGPIYQGPARNLSTFAHGFMWGQTIC